MLCSMARATRVVSKLAFTVALVELDFDEPQALARVAQASNETAGHRMRVRSGRSSEDLIGIVNCGQGMDDSARPIGTGSCRPKNG